jgi:peptidyl-dipeptidase A
MWRSKSDMPPDEFPKELDRLWDQVRPLYLKLHAYVRLKLREMRRRRARNSPIRASAREPLGEDWSNIYPLVAPPRRRDSRSPTS